MKFKYLFFISFVFVGITACNQNAPKEYFKLTGFTQGTTYGVIYYDSLGRNFSDEIESILFQVDTSMSVYNPESIINEFNNSKTGTEVDSLLADVVNISLKISAETNNAFDITVGPRVKAWGLHMKKGEMPSDDQVEKLLANIGTDKICITNHFLSKMNGDVMIDVNAIAQGYTVDVVSEFLETNGVNNYLVELGGEIRSKGESPRGDKWIVGVDKPFDNALSGETLQVKLAITNSSLVTSGNYRKFFEKDGVKYSHTINPKTGYPVTHTLLSATVIDKTAARADALATAFMVMGMDSTKNWLAKNSEVEAYLIYSNENGEYEVWMSDGVTEMIKK